jgi:hypothetical protein
MRKLIVMSALVGAVAAAVVAVLPDINRYRRIRAM